MIDQLCITDPPESGYILESFDYILEEKNTLLPSEWSEMKRFLPPGTTPQPGPWSPDVAPYAVEPLNHFADSSPVREVAIVKGAQTTFTVSVAENCIGYTIDSEPCGLGFVTADEQLAKDRMDLNIDPLIDNSDLRHKIFSQTEKRNSSRKGGDTQNKKEFPGGWLIAASIQSANRGRSFSFKKLIIDEIDAAKVELGKDGDPTTVFKTRTNAYENERKIFYISTPLEKKTSKIWPLFKLGDQRYFHIECPDCGHKQILKFEQLRYKVEDASVIPDSVYYLCEKCEATWKNYDKVHLLKNGKWIATAVSKRPGLISYHISALYSPVGFKSWETICQEYVEAQEAIRNGDMSKMKSFENLVLGLPHEERGESPRYELIMARRDDYTYVSGTLPDNGPLFCTFGADVHKNRIETEIVAWGKDHKSWSHSYTVLEGDIEENEVWEKFEELITTPITTRSGRTVHLMIGFVDAGYKPAVVYNFTEKMNGVFPIMGQPNQTTKKWKIPFKSVHKEDYDIIQYDLNVDFLKDWLYTGLKRGPDENDNYPPGFCFFPRDYKEKFFRQLTSEEKIIETDKYGNKRFKWSISPDKRNEALDCRVYALGALFVFAWNICVDHFELDSIRWKEFWDYMSKQILN